MIQSARSEAISIAREKLARHPLYLDTETTGNGPNDEIIQIAILDEEGQVLIDSLVRPTVAVSREAQGVHGIGAAALAGAPRWFLVWPKVEAILAGQTVGTYNADFDMRLIHQTNAKYRIRWPAENTSFFCIMKLYAQYYGEWNRKTGGYRYHSLETARARSGIALPNAHQACADALLARALLHYMAGSSTTIVTGQ